MPRAKVEDIVWDEDSFVYKRHNDQNLYLFIYQFIKANNLKSVSMISLPAGQWIFEAELMKRVEAMKLEFSVTGVEKRKSLFTEFDKMTDMLKSRFPRFGINAVKGTFESSLARERSIFNVVYLDWMGTWDTGTRKDINLLFKSGRLADNALIIFTVMSNRGGKEKDTPDTFRLCNSKYLSIPVEKIHERYISLLDNPRRSTRDIITSNFRRNVNGIPHSVSEHAEFYGYKVDDVNIMLYPGKYKQRSKCYQYEISFSFLVSRYAI